MLVGAGVLPSTFDLSNFNEETVDQLITTGMELLRMIKEGDPNSDDKIARDTYRDYFAVSDSSVN